MSKDSKTKFTTIRESPWSYIHLTLRSETPSGDEIDILTAKRYIDAALVQFLGDTGAAIPFDILKLQGQAVWIRVPRQDERAVVAAVGGWVSREGREAWRVEAVGRWLGTLLAGSGNELFITPG
ncbi:MAG: hypothetical protein M1814_003857 [Vezdaea aestivalis]|nr:MAG: hypothetical protein M1814_003857 [Vezdaea aestivalis]